MSQPPGPLRQQPASSELANALSACRRAFYAIAMFSGMSNLLMLTSALFMLEVYDRVLPSRSVPTLVALLLLAAGMYAAQGVIDMIRSRILVRVGRSLDEAMSSRVYDAVVRLPLKVGNRGEGTQPIRDLDTVRGFLSGIGPVAFFDLPWIPIYLAICFIFHFYIGLTALCGAIVLGALAVVTELQTRHPTRSATQYAAARNTLLEASRRNAEAITAMGMVGRISRRWGDLNRHYIAASGRASDVGGGLGAMSKVLRMLLQSAILAVGAALVINQMSTPGIIIAGSILGARALAPVDMAIANWRGFVGARQSWAAAVQIARASAAGRRADAAQAAGALARGAECRRRPARRAKDRIAGHQFHAHGRQGARRDRTDGVGKILAGAHAGRRLERRCAAPCGLTARRSINGRRKRSAAISATCRRTSNCSTARWRRTFRASRSRRIRTPSSPRRRPPASTISSSVCRTAMTRSSAITAARLSAGQAQRLALARALYRDPFLVVLDEPNSNLDAEGDEALTRAILGLRARGAIVVVVAHRPSAIAGVDYILIMGKGRQQQFGPKEEILTRVTAQNPPPRALKVAEQGGAG